MTIFDKVFKSLLEEQNRSPFFRKNIGSNNSFTLIENNFKFLKIAKFEFKLTVHYGLWGKCNQLLPIKRVV